MLTPYSVMITPQQAISVGAIRGLKIQRVKLIGKVDFISYK
jgi:hypothetical protein